MLAKIQNWVHRNSVYLHCSSIFQKANQITTITWNPSWFQNRCPQWVNKYAYNMQSWTSFNSRSTLLSTTRLSFNQFHWDVSWNWIRDISLLRDPYSSRRNLSDVNWTTPQRVFNWLSASKSSYLCKYPFNTISHLQKWLFRKQYDGSHRIVSGTTTFGDWKWY